MQGILPPLTIISFVVLMFFLNTRFYLVFTHPEKYRIWEEYKKELDNLSGVRRRHQMLEDLLSRKYDQLSISEAVGDSAGIIASLKADVSEIHRDLVLSKREVDRSHDRSLKLLSLYNK